eukprot:gene1323-2546_t
MGGISSTIVTTNRRLSIENLIDMVMPEYCEKDVVLSPSEVAMARSGWGLILTGSSPAFLAIKDSPDFNSSTCLTWFYDSFYKRLFDVAPATKPLFKPDISSQGRALVGMISSALKLLDNLDALVPALQNLARIHSERHIRAAQYNPVGAVLLWTLELCLGEAFDANAKHVWLRIYSLMMSVIIPTAVEDELKSMNGKELP